MWPLTLEIISGPDDFDSTVAPPASPPAISDLPAKKHRIAFFKALLTTSLDPEISTAIQGLVKTLRLQGHDVEPVAFDLRDYIVPAYYILTTAEVSSKPIPFRRNRYGYRTSQATDDLTTFMN